MRFGPTPYIGASIYVLFGKVVLLQQLFFEFYVFLIEPRPKRYTRLFS